MSEFKILLGTKNPGKVREAREILKFSGRELDILSFRELEFFDVEESGETYLENSLKKARSISEELNIPVLSDDSGLEVSCLDGKPGVFSSRFAGAGATDKENLERLLEEMKACKDRSAKFVTVATLFISSEQRYVTRGELKGSIARKPKGDSGFGYDPVFVPRGYDLTLAELGQEEKNRISHRREALEKMKDELKACFNMED